MHTRFVVRDLLLLTQDQYMGNVMRTIGTSIISMISKARSKLIYWTSKNKTKTKTKKQPPALTRCWLDVS